MHVPPVQTVHQNVPRGRRASDGARCTITTRSEGPIADLDPGLTLPDENIAMGRHSGGSGTPFMFVDDLAKLVGPWPTKIDASTPVAWLNGVDGKGIAGREPGHRRGRHPSAATRNGSARGNRGVGTSTASTFQMLTSSRVSGSPACLESLHNLTAREPRANRSPGATAPAALAGRTRGQPLSSAAYPPHHEGPMAAHPSASSSSASTVLTSWMKASAAGASVLCFR